MAEVRGGEQRGLAGVGQADDADLGDEFELEAEAELFARFARGGGLGGLVGGGFEVLVAVAAAAAFGDDDAVAGLQVVDQVVGVGVEDEGAGGELDDELLAGGAGALFAAARLAVLGDPLNLVAEVVEGAHAVFGDDDDIGAVTTIATVWAAFGLKHLATPGDSTGATCPSADVNYGLVYKHPGS